MELAVSIRADDRQVIEEGHHSPLLAGKGLGGLGEGVADHQFSASGLILGVNAVEHVGKVEVTHRPLAPGPAGEIGASEGEFGNAQQTESNGSVGGGGCGQHVGGGTGRDSKVEGGGGHGQDARKDDKLLHGVDGAYE